MYFTKKLITTVAISATLATTIAISSASARINTTTMTCNQAQDLVYSSGSILLSTGRTTFDRFVSNRQYCPTGDYIKPAFVRTRDQASCSIGYTCTVDDPWERWRRWD